MIDAQAAAQLIVPVRAALAEAQKEAASISDADQRAQVQGATAMLQRAVDHWATDQLAIVQSGAKPDSWWTDYGQELLTEAQRFVRDNGDFFAQYSRALDVLGNGAQAIQQFIDQVIQDARNKLAAYKKQLDGFNAQELTLETVASTLYPYKDQLSAEAQDLLFGDTAQEASNKLSTGDTIIANVDHWLSELQSGNVKAIVQDGDVSFETSTPTSVQGTYLAEIPVIAAGAVGLLAVFGILAAIVSWLYAYYQHANQVVQSDEVTKLLNTISDPNTSEQVKEKLSDALGKLAGQKPPDPFSGLTNTLTTIVKVTAWTAGLGLAGYAAVKWGPTLVAWLERKFRKTNPRRRRRRRVT